MREMEVVRDRITLRLHNTFILGAIEAEVNIYLSARNRDLTTNSPRGIRLRYEVAAHAIADLVNDGHRIST